MFFWITNSGGSFIAFCAWCDIFFAGGLFKAKKQIMINGSTNQRHLAIITPPDKRKLLMTFKE
jgi:hypothetical protein